MLDATAAAVAPIFEANLRVLSERGEIEPQPRLERDLAEIAERGGGSDRLAAPPDRVPARELV